MRKLIVALDVPSAQHARMIREELAGLPVSFKVGLELVTAIGVPAALDLFTEPKSVMLDLKLHDIPSTMVGAIKTLEGRPQVWGVTFHASAGPLAMREVLQAAEKIGVLPIAVTVLTSIGRDESNQIFHRFPEHVAREFVDDLDIALDEVGGEACIVCSPAELVTLQVNQVEIYSNRDAMTFITPGVRPLWAAANDQARVMRPRAAIDSGADHVVIGRPITRPPEGMSIRAAAERVLEEIAA